MDAHHLVLQLLVLVVSAAYTCAHHNNSMRFGGLQPRNLAQESLKYKWCEPSLKPFLLENLRSSRKTGSIRSSLNLLCRFLSYPGLRRLLGHSFNPAWYPTTSKLLRGVLDAAIRSPLLGPIPGAHDLLRAFRDDVKTTASAEVRLEKIAAPLGILPPKAATHSALAELKGIVSKTVVNTEHAHQLLALFNSGSLPQVLKPSFDASLRSTYYELINSIWVDLKYNHPAKDAMYKFLLLLGKTEYKDTYFEPQLVYELGLPAMSNKSNAFIKELVYTPFDVQYHGAAMSLEDLLIGGTIFATLPYFDFNYYKTKGGLLKHIVDSYLSALGGEMDPFFDMRNVQVRFLKDKIHLNNAGSELLDTRLLSSLNKIARSEKVVLMKCMRMASRLFQHFPFLDNVDLCKPLYDQNNRNNPHPK